MSAIEIYCCACSANVSARLTDGREIYPHRPDLADLPFWRCPECGAHVGCHHKTADRTKPLGCIPSPEVKSARQHIHRVLDPLWQGGRVSRKGIYRMLAERMGTSEYHTAEIRSVEEARAVYRHVLDIEKELRG